MANKKRKQNDPISDMVTTAQPLLDTLLGGQNVAFTEKNVIEASGKLSKFNVSDDQGETISEQLTAMKDWLDAQPLPRSRSDADPRKTAIATMNQKITTINDHVQYLREQAAFKNRAPAAQGTRGDGNFYITSVKMGQGDCTLITTPEGRLVMIDCGSDATDGEKEVPYKKRVRGVIYDKKFLKDHTTLDVLILTHPDSDHYNRLNVMLNNDIKILDVYHSAQLTSYAVSNMSAWIRDHCTRQNSINAVTHDLDTINTVQVGAIQLNGLVLPQRDPNSNNSQTKCLDESNGIRIIDEPKCKISILASNVNHAYTKTANADNNNAIQVPINDQSNITNRGSVITIIEVFGEKILICGDATRITEEYVLRTNKARISNLSISQAPHHGSNNTSSGKEFVKTVNSKKVLISAGREVSKDHLPSSATITRYSAQMTTSHYTEIDEHKIYYWEPAAMGSYLHSEGYIKRPIHITGSWGSVELSFAKPGNN